jgi:hypothetical protein
MDNSLLRIYFRRSLKVTASGQTTDGCANRFGGSPLPLSPVCKGGFDDGAEAADDDIPRGPVLVFWLAGLFAAVGGGALRCGTAGSVVPVIRETTGGGGIGPIGGAASGARGATGALVPGCKD